MRGWRWSNPPNVDFVLNVDSPQARGLLAWLPFTGMRRRDNLREMVNRSWLTPTGTPTPTQSSLGLGYALDGADDYWVQPLSPWDRISAGLDFSLVVTLQYTSTAVMSPFSIEASTSQPTAILQCNQSGAGRIKWFHRDAAGANMNVEWGAGNGNNGLPRQIIVVRRVGVTTWLYVDNVERATSANQPAAFTPTVCTLGARVNFSPTEDYNGLLLQDVRLYDHALSEGERNTLWQPDTRWDLWSPQIPIFSGGIATSLELEGYRFRNDDGSETTATWRQAQDTADSIGKNANIRLRPLIDATGVPPASAAYTVQWRKQGAGNNAWRDIKQ